MTKKREVSFDDFYRQMLGERWEALRKAMAEEVSHIGLSTLPGADSSEALLVPYYLDPASLAAALALGVKPGETVLDLCAAPGGKSLALALTLGGCGRLVANERSAARRERLKRVLEEHLPAPLARIVEVYGHDATRWGMYEQSVYDRVLLDAPCSSERHVLHDPAHLAKWGPARTRHLAATQHAMLCAALEAVRVGGVILYSTCALSLLENDQVIDRLAKKRGDRFAVTPVDLPGGERTVHGTQLWPDRCEGIGPIYMARLTRLL